VDESGSVLSVSPSQLRRQLEVLRHRGARALTGEELLARLSGTALDVADKEVFITFDDGYANLLHQAGPILAELGIPATVFISCDLMGGALESMRRAGRIMHGRASGQKIGASGIDYAVDVCSRERLLTWDEAGRLADFGIEVQSHSAGHDFLTQLGDQELTDNLTRSRDRIARKLGVLPTMIAYPFGDCNARVASIARGAGFSAGFLAEPWSVRDDPMRIGRRGIYEGTSSQDLAFILSAGFDLHVHLRDRLVG